MAASYLPKLNELVFVEEVAHALVLPDYKDRDPHDAILQAHAGKVFLPTESPPTYATVDHRWIDCPRSERPDWVLLTRYEYRYWFAAKVRLPTPDEEAVWRLTNGVGS